MCGACACACVRASAQNEVAESHSGFSFVLNVLDFVDSELKVLYEANVAVRERVCYSVVHLWTCRLYFSDQDMAAIFDQLITKQISGRTVSLFFVR